MTNEEFKKTLSDKDVTELCNVAKQAWDNASDKAKSVTFTWRKRKFKSEYTTFGMTVNTLNGEPVAKKYH